MAKDARSERRATARPEPLDAHVVGKPLEEVVCLSPTSSTRPFASEASGCSSMPGAKPQQQEGVELSDSDPRTSVSSAEPFAGEGLSQHYPMLDSRGRLPKWRVLLWGAPAFFFLILFAMKLVVMKRFYTDNHGANMGYMSIFVTLGVLVDAFTDPAMASWTDNCRSRFGRRRPFILLGSIIAVPIFSLSYTPLVADGIPATIWYGGFHIGSKLVDTVFMISHDAWGADMTPHYEERSLIFMVRAICLQTGALLGSAMPVVGRVVGLAPVALAASLGLVVTSGCLVAVGKERKPGVLPVPDKQQWSSDSIVPALMSTCLNRAYVVLILVFTVEFLGIHLPFEILPFLLRSVLGEECLDADSLLASLAAVRMVASMVSTLFWLRAARYLGKFWVLTLTTLINAVLVLPVLAWQRDEYPSCTWLKFGLVQMVIQGCFLGAGFFLKSLISDIIDYDELLSGKRREAMYMMACEFLPKFAQIPSTALFFFLLARFNYQRPGEWRCCEMAPAGVACGEMRPIFLEERSVLQKHAINELTRYGSTEALCGACASHCCLREDPAQPEKVIWLMKIGVAGVPSIVLLLAFLALLKFPRRARTQEAHTSVLKGIEEHRQGRACEDPWFPGRLLPPPPAETKHANLLSHLWPYEIRGMLAGGAVTPNYRAPIYSCTWQLALGASSAALGVAIFILGWNDLQTDLGGSFSPIGAMLIGFAVLVLWFNGVRLRAAIRIREQQPTAEELRQHLGYLGRFTGDEVPGVPVASASELQSEAKPSVVPRAELPQQESPSRDHCAAARGGLGRVSL